MKKYVLYGLVLGLLTLFIGLYIRNWYAFKAPTSSATERPEMHIAFGVNDTYAEPLKTAITSLLWHNQKSRVHLYVLYETLSEENQQDLTHLASFFPNADITFIETQIPDEFKGLLNHTTITKETFLRFSLPTLLPPTVDKALYLDADIVINGSLQSFFDTPLQNAVVAGVIDAYSDGCLSSIKAYEVKDYINGGVLLMNLKAIREENLLPEVYAFIHDNLDNPTIALADQDVLNILWQERLMLVEKIYNTDMRVIKTHRGVVLHYVERKPWREWMWYNFYWNAYERMKKTLLANQDNMPYARLVFHQTLLDMESLVAWSILYIVRTLDKYVYDPIIVPLATMMEDWIY